MHGTPSGSAVPRQRAAHPRLGIGAVWIAFLALLTSCGTDPAGTLRLSGIPDKDKSQLAARKAVVEAWLGKVLGMPVLYQPVGDYRQAVTNLAAGQLDLVWLGGATACMAETETSGEVEFVATRQADLEFKSLLIASRDAVSSGRVPGQLGELADLTEHGGGLSITFGDQLSTSGHIMPRHFLGEAGIVPEEAFARVGFSGNHGATLLQVRTGQWDLGAINYKNVTEDEDQVEVIWTSPPFTDYCLVAHNRVGRDRIDAIRTAFMALDPANPADQKVLGAFQAERFVAADPTRWDGIRKVLKNTDQSVFQR